MIKLLFATTNDAKVNNIKSMLSGLPIEIVSLKDFPSVEPSPETGSTALENATEKAKYYFDKFHVALFSCDSVLEIENLPKELQPTADTRSVGGKTLNDEELIQHFIGLANRYGKLKSRYRNAICYISEDGEQIATDDLSLSTETFYFTNKQHGTYLKGFPLDSISVDENGAPLDPISAEGNGNPVDNKKTSKKSEGFLRFFINHIINKCSYLNKVNLKVFDTADVKK